MKEWSSGTKGKEWKKRMRRERKIEGKRVEFMSEDEAVTSFSLIS